MCRIVGVVTLGALIGLGGPGCAGSGSGAGGDGAGGSGSPPDAAAVDTAPAPGDGPVSGFDGPAVDLAAGDGPAPDVGGARDAAADTGLAAAACRPPVDITRPPARLSESGCMDPGDVRKMAAAVVPYDLNSPLWSDGADKIRGMAVPAGQKVHVINCAREPALCPRGAADDGKFVMPVGTVLVKSFLFDDKLIETRLFMRHEADKWVGYSYQWNEAQTEATLVAEAGADASFNTGKRTVGWTFPSRTDCLRCHLPNAGSSLGPEIAQLNRPAAGGNQLDRLERLGLFDAPLARPYKAALSIPYASQAGTPAPGATVEQRVRAYLHANCGFCHRPDTAQFSALDLRNDVPFKDTGTCGATPMKGDVGVPGALVIKPGKPEESAMWLRTVAPPVMVGKGPRMPPLASKVVDQDATDLIKAWITSLTGCP